VPASPAPERGASGRLDGREQGAEVPASPAPERGASADPDLPHDPGIPGTKVPEELPPQDEPEVERVPDADQPDYDEEGSRNPKGA